MRVTLLHVEGCPSRDVAEGRLREALAVLGYDVQVEAVLVGTPQEADAWGFHGSPSVLVDGRDPFAAEGAAVGLSCRLYPTPDGLRGSPTVDQLVEALRSS
ncbi:MAG: thioredoxin family protein [Actinotalea sp.]|nr:thioredoxin family protein [Actinotalea sp.]